MKPEYTEYRKLRNEFENELRAIDRNTKKVFALQADSNFRVAKAQTLLRMMREIIK